MEAAARGLDLIGNPFSIPSDDQSAEMEAERMRGFSTYGVGKDKGHRQLYHSTPRDSDPHVVVRPFFDRLPAAAVSLLSDPSFQAQMQAIAVPYDPMPADFGKARYSRVVYAVCDAVQGFQDIY